MDAIEQLFKAVMSVLIVLGWMGIALSCCGLAILIFRVLKILLKR